LKSLRLTGIGLRHQHYAEFLEIRPKLAFIEIHSENYFGEGGKSLQILDEVSRDYPISLHGVSLSLGSADELNWQHLKKLRDLCERVNPCLISDHLCWSSINGQYLHDLLPLPFTDEAVGHIATRIQQVQEYLRRQILIENITSYVRFPDSTLSEAEFMNAIVKQSGCGILLDINNVYVNAINHNESAETFIHALPATAIQEIHLAGFAMINHHDKNILIDSHNQIVDPAVWDLFRHTIQHIGVKPTIIEWDSDLPALEILHQQASHAETIMREIYAATKLTG